MARLLLASWAFLAFASSSAVAADLPLKAPLPPASIWTGCYINGGGGYGMWNSDHNLETFPGLVPLDVSTTSGGRGWFGVAGAGCDYQFHAFNTWDVVIGAFGDYDFMNIHGIVSDPVAALQGNANEQEAWAAGLRAGILITPTLLTYINGGYTGARVGQVNFSTPTGVPTLFASPAHSGPGWFIGSGTEYALTWLPISGLFWRNEYRFSSYQPADVESTVAGVPVPVGNHIQSTSQTISTELVWRFNWIGPISARY